MKSVTYTCILINNKYFDSNALITRLGAHTLTKLTGNYNKQELVIKTSHQVFVVTWCESENDFFTQLECKI